MAKFQKLFFHRFSETWKLPQKNGTSRFTRCLVPEIRIFGHFWPKSAFLGLNSSRTKEIPANFLGYRNGRRARKNSLSRPEKCEKFQRTSYLHENISGEIHEASPRLMTHPTLAFVIRHSSFLTLYNQRNDLGL